MTDHPRRGIRRPSPTPLDAADVPDIGPEEPPLDLSALEGPRGADREEMVARAIAARAASALAARRTPSGTYDLERVAERTRSQRATATRRRGGGAGLLGGVASWRRPALAAAALVFVAAGVLLRQAAPGGDGAAGAAGYGAFARGRVGAPGAAARPVPETDVTMAVAVAVGVPTALSRWVGDQAGPSADVVLAVFATDGGVRAAADADLPARGDVPRRREGAL